MSTPPGSYEVVWVNSISSWVARCLTPQKVCGIGNTPTEALQDLTEWFIGQEEKI